MNEKGGEEKTERDRGREHERNCLYHYQPTTGLLTSLRLLFMHQRHVSAALNISVCIAWKIKRSSNIAECGLILLNSIYNWFCLKLCQLFAFHGQLQ